MRFATHALAALVLAALPAAAEDLTFTAKVTKDGAPAGTSTTYISADHARFSQSQGQEAILDLTTGNTTVINGAKKEYFVITPQDWDTLSARMKDAMNSPEMQKAQQQMKEAQEKMKNLPPDVQKKMQAMMNGGMMGAAAADVEVKKLGTSRKIAGYSCDDWTWSYGQMTKTDQCLTSQLPVPTQALERFREYSLKMMSMMQAMGPMAKGAAQFQEKMRDMKGIPLSSTTTVNVMGHNSTTTTEVTEVKKGPIPASTWQPPAGYTKVDNPMLKEMAAPKR
jgi:hypothetical protein